MAFLHKLNFQKATYHKNKITYKESLEILEDIKLKVLSLGINNNPDLEWGKKFIKKCYNHYDTILK